MQTKYNLVLDIELQKESLFIAVGVRHTTITQTQTLGVYFMSFFIRHKKMIGLKDKRIFERPQNYSRLNTRLSVPSFNAMEEKPNQNISKEIFLCHRYVANRVLCSYISTEHTLDGIQR